jgi:hypothetical protein
LPLLRNFADSAGTCSRKQELLTKFCAGRQMPALQVKQMNERFP